MKFVLLFVLISVAKLFNRSIHCIHPISHFVKEKLSKYAFNKICDLLMVGGGLHVQYNDDAPYWKYDDNTDATNFNGKVPLENYIDATGLSGGSDNKPVDPEFGSEIDSYLGGGT